MDVQRPEQPAGATARPPHPARAAALRLAVLGVVLLFGFTAVFVAAFHNPEPHRVGVAVVGSRTVLAQARVALDPAEFDVKSYASEASARAALDDDRVRGVLVAGPGRAEVITASAYGFVPTQVTKMALLKVAAVGGTPVAQIDERPLPRGDSRGLSSFFTVTGTIMASTVFAILLTFLGGGLSLRARLLTCGAVAAAGGVTVAVASDTVVGALTGSFWGLAGIAALLVAAVVATVHGLGRLVGPAGIAVSALTLVLVGVSSAGGGVTYQLQPGFYRALSQLLPNGAAVTAVRNEVYFSGAHTAGALIVLAAWTVAGTAALMLSHRRGRLQLTTSSPRPAAQASVA